MCYRLKSYRPKPFYDAIYLLDNSFDNCCDWNTMRNGVLSKQFQAGLRGFRIWLRNCLIVYQQLQAHSLIWLHFNALEVNSLWVCLTCATFRSCWIYFNSCDKSSYLISSAVQNYIKELYRQLFIQFTEILAKLNLLFQQIVIIRFFETLP